MVEAKYKVQDMVNKVGFYESLCCKSTITLDELKETRFLLPLPLTLEMRTLIFIIFSVLSSKLTGLSQQSFISYFLLSIMIKINRLIIEVITVKMWKQGNTEIVQWTNARFSRIPKLTGEERKTCSFYLFSNSLSFTISTIEISFSSRENLINPIHVFQILSLYPLNL